AWNWSRITSTVWNTASTHDLSADCARRQRAGRLAARPGHPAATWDSGEGAYRVGGRWNSRGTRAVYCSLDPATAILEVAVHKGFRALDTVAHRMTAAVIADTGDIHIVDPQTVPNRNWLRPGIPGAGQQAFGDELLR